MWFEALTGFVEESPEQVREHIHIDGEVMISIINGKRYQYGELEIVPVSTLRERVQAERTPLKPNTVSEVVANVQDLHCDPSHAGAMFQVASQFNLLEMVSPHVTPEQGIGIYEQDRTQGPACAIACGAGTIYRNYFVPVNGMTGQSMENQIDCLSELGAALGNQDAELWTMKNGYALATENGLREISSKLQDADEVQRDRLRKLLNVGIQADTQVTLHNCNHRVSQIYCSALPVAYSQHAASLWEPFARLILESAYEATICTAILNSRRTGNHELFLTLLGGGAFGNKTEWIIDAMKRALLLYPDHGLEIMIVSFGSSNPALKNIAFNSTD